MGVNTAAIHMATGVGVPTLTIYGPSDPAIWKPPSEKHHVVRKSLPCLPCRLHGCSQSSVSSCLDELTADEVWEELDALLSMYLSSKG